MTEGSISSKSISGKRPMDELDVVPVAVPALDVASEHDLDVLRFPVAQVEPLAVRALSAVSRGPSCHRPLPLVSHARGLHPSVR